MIYQVICNLMHSVFSSGSKFAILRKFSCWNSKRNTFSVSIQCFEDARAIKSFSEFQANIEPLFDICESPPKKLSICSMATVEQLNNF